MGIFLFCSFSTDLMNLGLNAFLSNIVFALLSRNPSWKSQKMEAWKQQERHICNTDFEKGYYYWACKPSKSQLMNFNSLWSPSSNEELWVLPNRFCFLIQFPNYLSLSNNKPHWGFSWVAVCLVEAWWKKLQGNCMQDAGGGNQLICHQQNGKNCAAGKEASERICRS